MTIKRKISSERRTQLGKLQKRMNLSFHSFELLNEALTHSSYANENPQAKDYERLEFFGDAVLKYAVSEYLLETYPDHDEGKLTEIRAVLISARILEQVANELSIQDCLQLARGVNIKPSMLARSMEAILGAICLDLGMQEANKFIRVLFCTKAEAINKDQVKDNFKAQLQQYTQSKSQGIPSYKVIDIEGPPHDLIFTVSVSVENKEISKGVGRSKKAAEQEAAKTAYKVLNKKIKMTTNKKAVKK